jgi:hypothetical protein
LQEDPYESVACNLFCLDGADADSSPAYACERTYLGSGDWDGESFTALRVNWDTGGVAALRSAGNWDESMTPAAPDMVLLEYLVEQALQRQVSYSC